MAISNLLKHYQRMKKILHIVETGRWKEYPSVAKMTIEQLENMRKTAEELEELGIHKVIRAN